MGHYEDLALGIEWASKTKCHDWISRRWEEMMQTKNYYWVDRFLRITTRPCRPSSTVWVAFVFEALTCLAETPEGRHQLQDYVDQVSLCKSSLISQSIYTVSQKKFPTFNSL